MKLKTAYDIDQDQVFSLIPELPEDIDKWIDENPMYSEQYFFTFRVDGKKYGYCTHCKTESPLSPELYRTVDQKIMDNYRTKHNQKGVCPNCGIPVVFKDDGRGRKYLVKFGYFTIAQPLADGGLMLRSFYVRKLLEDYRTAQNELSEHIRIYYNIGIAAGYQRSWSGCFIPQQGDYYEKYSAYYTSWNELEKVPVPNPHRGNIYQSESFGTACRGFSAQDMKDTVFKYACVDRAMDFLHESRDWHRTKESIVRYLELYLKYPVLTERLMKQGFEKIVFEKVLNIEDSRGVINWNRQDAAGALKLTKDDVRAVEGQNTLQLALYQLNKAQKASKETRAWIEKNIDCSCEARMLKKLTRYAPLNRIIKYLRAQKKKKQCVQIRDYDDYILQCTGIGLDLTNACVLFPENFQKAHNENTQLLATIKVQKEAEEMKEEDKAFGRRYKMLCKKYAFETDDLFIRPASGKAELLIEGKTLNHCVYTNYADCYISGRTLICVIRQKKQPETPFYTLEYSPSSKTIIQCRGFRNCAMTDEVKSFCESWKKSLETKIDTKKQSVPIGA